jgi:hypothetical protein
MDRLGHPRLSVKRQCELVGVARPTLYYEAEGESACNLGLTRLM